MNIHPVLSKEDINPTELNIGRLLKLSQSAYVLDILQTHLIKHSFGPPPPVAPSFLFSSCNLLDSRT